MPTLDEEAIFQQLASDILRQLRGRRSRPGFSRILGYSSNISQRWEAGESWPSAPRFFELCRQLGRDPKEAVAKFLRRRPAWLEDASLVEANGVAALLGELRGRTPIQVIAERSGYNRYSVGRWLKGSAIPKLPELLRVVEACCRRSLDFVAAFVDPAELPSVAKRWQALQKLRQGASLRPLSHAVLRALELRGYQEPGTDPIAFLAQHTGCTPAQVQESLEYLQESGQVHQTSSGYRAAEDGVVDTGDDPERARALRIAWSRIAVDRLERGNPGQVGYSVFAISRLDLKRLEQVQQDYLRQMRAIIAGSDNCDCVGLYCAQLLDLGSAPQ
jgi:transcriptional regulator with XRE-family HTH domain